MRWVGLDGSRTGVRAFGLLTIVGLIALLVAGSAAAAGNQKLVEGTLYDATCAASCSPCPPPCGPIVRPQSDNDVICAGTQKRVACPLASSRQEQRVFKLCSLGGPVPCGTEFPVYMGEGAVVTIRSKKSGRMIGPLPVVEGHFKVSLGPGYWVVRPYIPPEPNCWTGPQTIEVTATMKSPVSAVVDVTDNCVAHPDDAK